MKHPDGLGFTGANAIGVALLGHMFETLGVGSTLWDGRAWHNLHGERNVLTFEVEHGQETARFRHNERNVLRAIREQRPVFGEHAGFADSFVPIVIEGRTRAVLITGPLATSRPDAAEIVERWRKLTGRQGHVGDAEFAEYVAVTLSTLVLEPKTLKSFQALLFKFAGLMAGDERGGKVLAEATELRRIVERARFAEHMWERSQSMVDARTAANWSSGFMHADLEGIGLSRAMEEVVVGLIVNRQTELEPVDEIVRRDAFQRACVELARQSQDTASGRVGTHGVTFLSALGSNRQRRRRALIDLAERASVVARRRFGFRMYLGASTLPGSATLSERYASALQAAEEALSRDIPLVETASTPKARPLAEMRRRLGALIEEQPDALPAHFDRYLEAVALHTAYRLEPARAHLEAGFERITEALAGSGTLEIRAFSDLEETLARAARECNTVAELFAAYRRSIRDLCLAVKSPVPARRERSIRRAVDYVRQHYTEPLSLARVAKVAGFAPAHFSVVFAEQEAMSFSDYVQKVRLERAQELLGRTELDLAHIARMSGFRSREYFARVFKRVMGLTPMESRRTLRV